MKANPAARRFVRSRFIIICLAVATLPMTLTGCVTRELWKKTLYYPAEQPSLRLAVAPDNRDVLVCYDEVCRGSTNAQWRAYRLFASTAAVHSHSKPKFVKPALNGSLTDIPVLEAAQTSLTPVNGYWAIGKPNASTFQLWWGRKDLGEFNLPVYEALPSGAWWRVGLTPVAVATDALGIAGPALGATAR